MQPPLRKRRQIRQDPRPERPLVYEKLSDPILVKRAKDGDAKALATLVERHAPRVEKLAAHVLADPEDARDAAQEALAKLCVRLRQFRGDSQFGSWLYRIAFNQAVNLKSRVRYRAPHLGDEVLDATPAAEPSALDRLHAARRDRALQDAIAELPEVYQSALRLHYWMDTSIADIAIMLGVPPNTVKSYMHRARHLLSATLRDKGFADV